MFWSGSALEDEIVITNRRMFRHQMSEVKQETWI